MRWSRRLVIGVLVIVLWSLWGCGGGGGSSPTRTTPLKVTINWAARGRALNAPSSALSVVLTLERANPNGSDAQFIINREANPAAYTQNWTSPTEINVGTFALTARFYASANGLDAVVGTASATVAIGDDGTGIGTLATQGTVASVELTGVPNPLPHRKLVPLFTVRDAQNNILSISQGSAFLTVTSGSEFARIENGELVGIAPGTFTLTATVDGRTSAPLTVEIPNRGLATDAAWAKERADAANTGRGKGQGATGIERWRLPLTVFNWLIPSPVILADGRVIYSMHAPPSQVSLNILDMATGQYLGLVTTPAAFSTYAPTLGADGTLYVSGEYPTSRNAVYALNGTTGGRKWEFDPPDALLTPPALSPDGVVYIGCSGHFYALDSLTGALLWQRALTNPTVPAVGKDGTAYTSSAGVLYALATPDGTERWQYNYGAASSLPPVYDAERNQVYIGDANGILHAVNTANGQRVWQSAAGTAAVTSVALGTNGRLYVGSSGGAISAFGAADGGQVWTFTEGSGSPKITLGLDGTVYASATRLYALDGTNGAKRWELGGGTFSGEPALALDGTLFLKKIEPVGTVPTTEAIVGVR
jgi:outer membrane protein assembly factor BamB